MRHRLTRRRWRRRAPHLLLGVVALAASGRVAAAQTIDPCAELPATVVEQVLATHGTRAKVLESIPMAFEGMGTCNYRFEAGSVRLDLLARRAGSSSEATQLFASGPRPDGAVTVPGVGDEAFRATNAGLRTMMFRVGSVMATVTLRGDGPRFDAAVVELGRRWVAAMGGATPLVAEAPRSTPPAPATKVVDAAPQVERGNATQSASDTIPACAIGITGPCYTDDAGHVALALREAIEDGEADVLRATIRDAVLSTGIAIVEDDGSATRPEVAPAQGIAVQAFELEGVARLYERGVVFPLDTVAASLAALVPGTDGATIVRHLLADLRHAAGSEHESMRSWARLIAELGMQHQRIDVLLPATRDGVMLDPLQLVLVLRRVGGELAARDRQSRSGHGMHVPTGGFDVRTAVAGLGGAPIRFSAPPRTPLAPARACAPNDIESIIMDWAAVGITTGSGMLVGYLEGALGGKAGRAAGTYGKATGVANHVLALVRLALTYTSIETEIEMEGNGPLLRTKSHSAPGERRTVRAKVNMDIDDAEWFNCVRLALNQFGLDFSVHNGGPLAGMETWWRLEEGGVTRRAEGGYDRGIVRFGPGQFTQRRYTDAEGRTSIMLEGAPQQHELSGAAREVMKQATVQLQVKIKTANLLKESADIAGVALSGPAAPIGAAIEMFYRSMIPVQALTFPVRDWTDRLRFRITRLEFSGGPGVECTKGTSDNYTEVFDVTVDRSGAVVEVRRNLGVCDIMESTAEGADHSRCWVTGSWQGRMKLDALRPQRLPDPYMHEGRPTRQGILIGFEPYPGTKATVSGCDATQRVEWHDLLERGQSISFPLMPEGATSVRSYESVTDGRTYLLEVLEGDIGTFRVQ